jgi:hypothetical protein
MKSLNDAVLHVGDIILATRDAKISKGIRLTTKSDISHAMVCVEAYSLIDSDSDGVHARNMRRLFWPDHCAIHVLRLKEGLTDDQLQKIIAHVRGKVGTRYSRVEAARSVLGGGRRPSRRQFCSRLVAQAYAAAGIHLVDSPDYCTPEEVRRSEKLIEVPGATRSMTDPRIEAMNRDADTTQLMRDAINRLLSGARTKNDSIEDLNDIDQHLIDKPKDDPYFARLLTDSGYLTAWRVEKDKNPWQYDLDLMNAELGAAHEKMQYCQAVVDEREIGLQRYEVNRAGYGIYFEQFHLEWFRMLKELYEILVELHHQRRNVAGQWLAQNFAAHAPASSRSSADLAPHSTEWFAALERYNPAQAAHTHLIVESERRLDVCSICGDTPAKDYRLVGHALPADAVRTLRLCNDCWGIRRGMYTESFGLS